MAGKLKSLKGKNLGKSKYPHKAKISKSVKSGLQFPVSRIARFLKSGLYSSKVSLTSSIYLCAVLEYLSAELLELAGNAAKDHQKTRITPRHLLLAIRNDSELDKFVAGATIKEGGILPGIQEQLLKTDLKGEAS